MVLHESSDGKRHTRLYIVTVADDQSTSLPYLDDILRLVLREPAEQFDHEVQTGEHDYRYDLVQADLDEIVLVFDSDDLHADERRCVDHYNENLCDERFSPSEAANCGYVKEKVQVFLTMFL